MPNHDSPVYVANDTLSVVARDQNKTWSVARSYNVKKLENKFSGVSNINWKRQILALQDASTNYAAYSARVKRCENHFFHSKYRTSYVFEQTVDSSAFMGLAPQALLDSIDTSAVDNAAKTEFYDKMSSSFDAGTFIGELKETIQMLHRPAASLRAAADVYLTRAYKLRSSILVEARREKLRLLRPGTSTLQGSLAERTRAAEKIAEQNALKKYKTALPGLILETNMGWRPLMDDIENAFERLKELLAEPGVERFRARAGSEFNLPRQVSTGPGHFDWSSVVSMETLATIQIQYVGAVEALKHHNLTISQKLAVDPGDLVVAGWNLLPQSWLIDYFVNIGDILNAIVLWQRLKYIYCVRTTRISLKVKLTQVGKATSTRPVVLQNIDGYGELSLKKVKREAIGHVPIPSLELTIAQSLRHQLNIGSLIAIRAQGEGFPKGARR